MICDGIQVRRWWLNGIKQISITQFSLEISQQIHRQLANIHTCIDCVYEVATRIPALCQNGYNMFKTINAQPPRWKNELFL